jgi:hypothetical protein
MKFSITEHSNQIMLQQLTLRRSRIHFLLWQDLSLMDCKLGQLSPGSLDGLAALVNLTINTRTRGQEEPLLVLSPRTLEGYSLIALPSKAYSLIGLFEACSFG